VRAGLRTPSAERRGAHLAGLALVAPRIHTALVGMRSRPAMSKDPGVTDRVRSGQRWSACHEQARSEATGASNGGRCRMEGITFPPVRIAAKAVVAGW